MRTGKKTIELTDQELFDQISDHYAKKDVVRSTKMARSAIVRRAVRPVLGQVGTLGTVLDIGCGIGAQLEYLDENFEKYIGVDYSENLIEIGRQRYGHIPNAEFLVANIKDPSLAENTADTILAVGALHHMQDLNEVFEALGRIAKPGAHFIAIEPQRGNPLIQFMRRIRMLVDSHYSSDQQFFSYKELENLFDGSPITDIRLEYQGFLTPPFAQVGISPQMIFRPLSQVACTIEPVAETLCFGPLGILSWNIVAYGRFAG